MAIEHVRVSLQAKGQLVRLKRLTGIKQWNVLCRWALCVSLAEQGTPSRYQRSGGQQCGNDLAGLWWDGTPTSTLRC